jgi:hypothetical protein
MFEIMRNRVVPLAIGQRILVLSDRLIHHVFDKAWPSYALVSLLQLKILWKIWVFRDLTTGDTSSYFSMAYQWYENFAVNIVWSPLYTSFYGSIFMLTRDAYAATILHRVIIVVAATLGVLAVMRTLLPPALALLIAAWWAILPINFETLYEVHLFALLPILAAWLVAAWKDSPWNRGTALAILVTATALVRNELIVAVIVFTAVCLVRELAELRQDSKAGTGAWRAHVKAYAVPLLLAFGICGFFYWRSIYKYPEIAEVSGPKHTVNMCQVYAVGYQQRHTDWNLHPWLECSQLMERVFGQPLPTLFEMIKANWQAVWEHFLWNLSLLPNGLQVSLFNAMSGTVNPDYAPVKQSWWALALSLAVLMVIAAAANRAVRQWSSTWRGWFGKRSDAWLIMLAVVCVAGPVVLTQRPRPSYLFPVSVFLMAVIGSAVHFLTHRRSVVMKRIAIGVVLVVLVTIRPYYVHHQSDRPLYTNYERLRPFAVLMMSRNNKILLGDYSGELQGYLGLIRANVRTFDYSLLLSWKREHSLAQFLDAQGINVFLVQPRIVTELRNTLTARELLDEPETVGWRRLAPESGDPQWFLLYREVAAGSERNGP